MFSYIIYLGREAESDGGRGGEDERCGQLVAEGAGKARQPSQPRTTIHPSNQVSSIPMNCLSTDSCNLNHFNQKSIHFSSFYLLYFVNTLIGQWQALPCVY